MVASVANSVVKNSNSVVLGSVRSSTEEATAEGADDIAVALEAYVVRAVAVVEPVASFGGEELIVVVPTSGLVVVT